MFGLDGLKMKKPLVWLVLSLGIGAGALRAQELPKPQPDTFHCVTLTEYRPQRGAASSWQSEFWMKGMSARWETPQSGGELIGSLTDFERKSLGAAQRGQKLIQIFRGTRKYSWLEAGQSGAKVDVPLRDEERNPFFGIFWMSLNGQKSGESNVDGVPCEVWKWNGAPAEFTYWIARGSQPYVVRYVDDAQRKPGQRLITKSYRNTEWDIQISDDKFSVPQAVTFAEEEYLIRNQKAGAGAAPQPPLRYEKEGNAPIRSLQCRGLWEADGYVGKQDAKYTLYAKGGRVRYEYENITREQAQQGSRYARKGVWLRVGQTIYQFGEQYPDPPDPFRYGAYTPPRHYFEADSVMNPIEEIQRCLTFGKKLDAATVRGINLKTKGGNILEVKTPCDVFLLQEDVQPEEVFFEPKEIRAWKGSKLYRKTYCWVSQYPRLPIMLLREQVNPDSLHRKFLTDITLNVELTDSLFEPSPDLPFLNYAEVSRFVRLPRDQVKKIITSCPR